MAEFNALRRVLEDDTMSDEALDFMADPYADRVTRLRRSGQASPELEAFLARTGAVQDQREAERAVEAASRLPKIQGAEISAPVRSTPAPMSVPEALRPSDWVTARPASAPQQTPPMNQLSLGAAPVSPPDSRVIDLLGPFFKPVDEASLPLKGIRLPVEEAPTMMAPARVAASRTKASQTAPAPAAAPAPAPAPVAPAVAPVPVAAGPSPTAAVPSAAVTKTLTVPPPPPAAPVAGAGGDADLDRLALGQSLIQGLETFGSAVSGKNLRSGMAESLGERYRQAQALQAKRAEQGIVDAQAQANNRAQVEYLMQRFPERREALAGLRDMTKSPNFSQMLRVEEQIALDEAKAKQTSAKTEDIGSMAGYRSDLLSLRRDTQEALNDWRAVQAGFRQAELDLKKAEAARKQEGSTEPSAQEQKAFQVAIKPANNTAVALKDAAGLDAVSDGMLRTGKPPEWLSRADIALFVSGDLGRSRLANSNPKAFDLLTEMARLKTMVGHEYFGSALSPSEAERQRQFLDFGLLDSPDSIAKKMRTYHKTLGDKASVWIKPLIRGPLGQNWLAETGLDQVAGPEGSFKGLFAAPTAPVAAPAGGTPAITAGGVERVIMIDKEGKRQAVRADQVERAKAERGWRMP